MWWKDLSSAEAFVGAAPKSPGRLHHLPRDLLQQQPLCGDHLQTHCPPPGHPSAVSPCFVNLQLLHDV
ncbi:hypothetical protein PVAP13_3KG541350 [Panicum virgatum]|uniref:Uncharacterized protein n=1 Tax=Panicum virgatum TaxID=38727 RepID=A0A8T0VFX7_PANVG|nr:hypothetical protein PVAP13_3KG541350 [Panicum virgatum]